MQIIVVNGYINTKSIMYSRMLVVFSIITYIAAKKNPTALQTNFLYGLKQFIIQVFSFLHNRKISSVDRQVTK